MTSPSLLLSMQGHSTNGLSISGNNVALIYVSDNGIKEKETIKRKISKELLVEDGQNEHRSF